MAILFLTGVLFSKLIRSFQPFAGSILSFSLNGVRFTRRKLSSVFVPPSHPFLSRNQRCSNLCIIIIQHKSLHRIETWFLSGVSYVNMLQELQVSSFFPLVFLISGGSQFKLSVSIRLRFFNVQMFFPCRVHLI